MIRYHTSIRNSWYFWQLMYVIEQATTDRDKDKDKDEDRDKDKNYNIDKD